MLLKIILVAGVLTAFAGCAQPMSGFYPSRLNGLAVSSLESSAAAKKNAAQIDVNNREMAKVNSELKLEVDAAERSARGIGGNGIAGKRAPVKVIPAKVVSKKDSPAKRQKR